MNGDVNKIDSCTDSAIHSTKVYTNCNRTNKRRSNLPGRLYFGDNVELANFPYVFCINEQRQSLDGSGRWSNSMAALGHWNRVSYHSSCTPG